LHAAFSTATSLIHFSEFFHFFRNRFIIFLWEITFSFEGAFISALTLGFNTTLEHKEPFYRHLPQYQTWQAPISFWTLANWYFWVYHAVITILGTSTASKKFFFYQLPVLLPLLSASSFAVSCF
jgi:hypothetical protein